MALVDEASDGSIYRYEDILEVVRYLRARDQVPTWIVGGSASTRSVVNVAADLPLAEPLGLIVFSPISVAAAQAARVKRPPEPDRNGLRALLREKNGSAPPASLPASLPADDRPDVGLDGLGRP